MLLFAAEGFRRVIFGIRLVTRKEGMELRDLGFVTERRVEGKRAKLLGIAYLSIGTFMVAATAWVALYRMQW